jgi:hypothetical protein
MPWMLLGVSTLLFSGGQFAKGAGEGVDKASNGFAKVAVTGALVTGGYLYLKAKKVL